MLFYHFRLLWISYLLMSLSKLGIQFYLLRVFYVFEITWLKYCNPGGQSGEGISFIIYSGFAGVFGWRDTCWYWTGMSTRPDHVFPAWTTRWSICVSEYAGWGLGYLAWVSGLLSCAWFSAWVSVLPACRVGQPECWNMNKCNYL